MAFSLSVILLGQVPFDAATEIESLAAWRDGSSGVDWNRDDGTGAFRRVGEVLEQAMRFDPSGRPADVASLAAMLDDAIGARFGGNLTRYLAALARDWPSAESRDLAIALAIDPCAGPVQLEEPPPV